MADLDAIRDLLQIAQGGGMHFAEGLVTTNLVGDWDLSRVVAEIFQLPFLPVGIIRPDEALWEDMDQPFMTKNGLVPLSRFGQVLTVAMPGLVPAEILGLLSVQTDMVILPVVGTVETNRRWLLEHRGGAEKKKQQKSGGDWGALFDEGEEAVRLSLNTKDEDDEHVDGAAGATLTEGLEGLEKLAGDSTPEGEPDLDAELEALGGLEFTGADDVDAALADITSQLEVLDVSDEVPFVKPEREGATKGGRGGADDIELPPQPEF